MAAAALASKSLSVTLLEPGDEKTFPREGDVVEAFYTGTLAASGAQFDSNVDKEPLRFTVGDGSMIEGWDTAIRDVSLGGKARVFVPAKRAYAEHGYPSPDGEGYAIPPDSDLVYDLQVVKVEKPKSQGDAQAPKKLTREEQEAAEKEQLRLWMEQAAAKSSTSATNGGAGKGKSNKKKKNNKKKGKK